MEKKTALEKIHNILQHYWGYTEFRPMQADIIMSVINGHDTLALLPTGGGKSICFQVPGLALEGLTLVISPLIALMKDQVENLKSRGIPAVAIYSGMHPREISNAIDNAVNGNTRFLYISPERLKTDTMKINLPLMGITLLAVDEAHCISQWGYDFRPPYLEIADARLLLPGVPVIALTATATPPVVEDIQRKLNFRNQNVFRKSFERPNLSYLVLREPDKMGRLLKIAQKVKGTGIVYVRNRKRTREIAEFLSQHGISASWYHAGLDSKTRDQRQSQWIKNEIRIIVSTNAFGMGIDKPDVRFVVHLDIPDNLEAYFQEAGRGGRDLKRSYAVMLFDDMDLESLQKNFENTYPEIKQIRQIYLALMNYASIPMGLGKDTSMDFDFTAFCTHYKFSLPIAHNALTLLGKEGYLMIDDALFSSSRIMVTIDKQDLYRFQVEHRKFNGLIKLLLRTYSGLFSSYVMVNEKALAHKAELSEEQVIYGLKKLHQFEVIHYLPESKSPQMVFLQPRIDERDVLVSKKFYYNRKKSAQERLNSVLSYVKSESECRSKMLLAYFGEIIDHDCGVCDYCKKEPANISALEYESIVVRIKALLTQKASTIVEISEEAYDVNEDKLLKVLQILLDGHYIALTEEMKYKWQ